MAYSDRQPVAFLVNDPTSDQLVKLGSSHNAIHAAQMGTRDFFHYKSRDGLELPVYVTLPPGYKSGRLPTVVLVHGGPWIRGAYWEWEDQAQFLASRGYVVIEPQFRGSVGFGDHLFRASFKQWGLTMQDDIADAAKWAIEKGYADPKRVALAGASYGGYATLMGLIKDPDLFRCGFEWVGVTDIDMMFSVEWNDTSIEYAKYGMPVLIGDPEKDAAQFKATSPLANAAKLNQPLLMAYGADDRRVPIVQGSAFYDAVRSHNNNVEWIVYKEEGHGWRHEGDNLDFWRHVEKFLDKNLKNAQ
jgi:dipeptidyl aminopeptidase/acylaminoacyl peptidase